MEPFHLLKKLFKCRTRAPRGARAFTLIEMLIVLGIIVILLSVIITGQSTFSRTLLLTDTAYTVALSARDAQTYGISSSLFSTSNNTGYGLYFTPNTASYIEFADTYPSAPGDTTIPGSSATCPGHADQASPATVPDERPGDCLYEANSDGVVRLYTFNSGYTIGSLAGILPGGTTAPTPSQIVVSFERPNTTAVLVGIINGVPTILQEAHIRVQSPQGNSECIVITQLGEVAVEQTCSP